MKTTSRFASTLLLAIVLGMAVGCARKPDDAKISADIQGKFTQDSGLSSKQLTVQASDGVVTLGGTVDNDAQREAASRQAATVPGVRTVVNNLQMGSAPAAAAMAQPATAMRGANPISASTSPADKPKSAAEKKSSRAITSENTAPAGNSASDSTSDQRNASSQTSPDPAPASAFITPPPAETAAAPAPPPPPPSPKRLIIDQGTQLAIRLIDAIDSEKNQTGDTFRATLNAALTSDGEEAVPAGVELTGHLVDVKSAGKFAGQSVVVLQLDKISSGGKSYSLETDQYRKEGKSRGKNTAEKVGGGAILGGIIGAIAGGGKGAAIGTAAGAGVGGGAQAASKSEQIKLPSETVLNFVLQAPIEVVKAPQADTNRPKLDSQ
jgi:BON domain